jgi:hypothetical protein
LIQLYIYTRIKQVKNGEVQISHIWSGNLHIGKGRRLE